MTLWRWQSRLKFDVVNCSRETGCTVTSAN
jgi:hypothetical protein